MQSDFHSYDDDFSSDYVIPVIPDLIPISDKKILAHKNEKECLSTSNERKHSSSEFKIINLHKTSLDDDDIYSSTTDNCAHWNGGLDTELCQSVNVVKVRNIVDDKELNSCI